MKGTLLQKLQKEELKKFGLANLAMLLMVIFIYLFLKPFKSIAGGIGGYFLIINYLFKWDLGLISLIINSGLATIAVLTRGKVIGAKTVVGYMIFSFYLWLVGSLIRIPVADNVNLVIVFATTILEGIIVPLFVSVVIRSGYSLGGYSIVFRIIERYFRITVSRLFLVLDVLLALLGGFTLGWEYALAVAVNGFVFYFFYNLWDKFVTKRVLPTE